MAEHEQAHEEENLKYTAPAEKSLADIVHLDAEDESLRKYKQALLGSEGPVIVDPNNPNKVIIKQLSLLVEGRPESTLDLTKSVEQIKKESFTLKECTKYKIKIYFYVQREIVSGLRYEHKVYRSKVHVDTMKQMMGSYGPKSDLQSFTTPEEEAPHGLLMRGDYKIKSRFVDDDKVEYVSWEWNLSVKKDW